MSKLAAVGKFLLKIPAILAFIPLFPGAPAGWNKIAQLLSVILKYAVPAVASVQAQTPNRTVEEISTLLSNLGVVAAIHPETPADDPALRGLLLQAASAALKRNIDAAIAKAGSNGLKLNGTKVTDSSEIEKVILDSAVQIAYTFFASKLS
jgi:hypothetical protein